jgi:hypothetical protein
MAYSRHRYLEVAGRYEEIFAPDMMAMDPHYHFSQAGNDMVDVTKLNVAIDQLLERSSKKGSYCPIFPAQFPTSITSLLSSSLGLLRLGSLRTRPRQGYFKGKLLAPFINPCPLTMSWC